MPPRPLDREAVKQAFDQIAQKIQGYSERYYLLSYCTPARAGEHGSGFAVVAGEVRRLARSSSEAADRTDQLVADVLERVDRVRQASLRAVDAAKHARQSAGTSVGTLEELDRAARDASAAAIAEENDATSFRATTEALTLPIQQMAREAESLSAALKDASSVAGSQQQRIQDLVVAANALARNAARSSSVLAGVRVGGNTAEMPAPDVVEEVPAVPVPAPTSAAA